MRRISDLAASVIAAGCFSCRVVGAVALATIAIAAAHAQTVGFALQPVSVPASGNFPFSPQYGWFASSTYYENGGLTTPYEGGWDNGVGICLLGRGGLGNSFGSDLLFYDVVIHSPFYQTAGAAEVDWASDTNYTGSGSINPPFPTTGTPPFTPGSANPDNVTGYQLTPANWAAIVGLGDGLKSSSTSKFSTTTPLFQQSGTVPSGQAQYYEIQETVTALTNGAETTGLPSNFSAYIDVMWGFSDAYSVSWAPTPLPSGSTGTPAGGGIFTALYKMKPIQVGSTWYCELVGAGGSVLNSLTSGVPNPYNIPLRTTVWSELYDPIVYGSASGAGVQIALTSSIIEM